MAAATRTAKAKASTKKKAATKSKTITRRPAKPRAPKRATRTIPKSKTPSLIVQDSVKHSSDSEASSEMLTPDCIEETPPPSQRDMRKLRKEMADMRHSMAATNGRGRVSKSHSHRRRRRHHDNDSSTDSEDDGGVKVSFLHAEGTKPFLHLHQRFRAVSVKYFKQIFFGTFKCDHLTKLAYGFNTKATNEDPQEASGIVQLLRGVIVYGQAICEFAHPSIALRLQQAFSGYILRLLELSVHHTFTSLREYNHTFMTARIASGHDNPLAWTMDDRGAEVLLFRKAIGPAQAGGARPLTNTAVPRTTSSGICRKFNEGRCTHEQCKYAHICSNCQQVHAANTCTKPPTSATNSTPLGSRISRPE